MIDDFDNDPAEPDFTCRKCGREGLDGQPYCFRPMDNLFVCIDCRKEYDRLNPGWRTLADHYDDFVMWFYSDAIPSWVHRLCHHVYAIYKRGPLGHYRMTKALNKFYESKHNEI
jgi:hypothetical protein